MNPATIDWFERHFVLKIGLVAQLNSASDYGSEGYRFESCRGHKNKLLIFNDLYRSKNYFKIV